MTNPLTEGSMRDTRKATTEALVRPLQAPPSPTPRRSTKAPEDIFLDHVKKLIKNLFIDNVNYNGNYYERHYQGWEVSYEIKKSMKDSAEYILQTIDQMEHLIKDSE